MEYKPLTKKDISKITNKDFLLDNYQGRIYFLNITSVNGTINGEANLTKKDRITSYMPISRAIIVKNNKKTILYGEKIKGFELNLIKKNLEGILK